MINLYHKNGLVFWTQEEIKLRKSFEEVIASSLFKCLQEQNSAFQIVQVEAPILTPHEFINPNYTAEEIYKLDDLTLRPETTMGSYLYIKELLHTHNNIRYRPPLVVWQHGKSFRREQDQSTKFMRLKEFYQLEFQIVYSLDTKNDYTISVYEFIRNFLSKWCGNCILEDSDRLPSYSTKTVDIICDDMELCSISKRNDFEGFNVLEVAIGTDRVIHKYSER